MLKRTELRSYKALKSNSKLESSKPMKKVGRKSKEWSDIRKEVLEYLETNNIPKVCEARLDGCTNSLYLTLAHSKKRRRIENKQQLMEVAILCSSCHAIVDSWKQENTEHYIQQLIERRNNIK